MATSAAPSLLAFFAHPDDESYAAGGTLALCARAGLRVRVLSATRGEAGGDGARREAELQAACEILGVEPPRFVGWPDGGVAQLPASAAVAQLRDALERLAPDVVLTLGPDGAYGHADHLACTQLLSQAVDTLTPTPRVLHAVFPRGLLAPVWRSLRRHLGPKFVPLATPEALGVAPQRPELKVDIRPVARQKRAAIAAHRSQLASLEPLHFLAPGLVEALSEQEWFVHAAGPALPPDARGPCDGLP
ncbi:MAG: PIG-L family deacetylase [Myxococcales bacterium]|nr:PIG-L family deacetylase [Myxococcales bacterium]